MPNQPAPNTQRFKQELNGLIGQTCGHVSGTAGVGSMVTIYFGDITVRPEYFGGTDVLPPRVIEFHSGEQQLIMEFAAWRCHGTNGHTCSSATPNGAGSVMETVMESLVGQRVSAVTLDANTFDLTLHFSEAVKFVVFCDRVDPEDGELNYTLKTQHGYYHVGPGFRVVHSER